MSSEGCGVGSGAARRGEDARSPARASGVMPPAADAVGGRGTGALGKPPARAGGAPQPGARQACGDGAAATAALGMPLAGCAWGSGVLGRARRASSSLASPPWGPPPRRTLQGKRRALGSPPQAGSWLLPEVDGRKRRMGTRSLAGGERCGL